MFEINPSNYDNLDKDTFKFYFEQSEKRLKSTLDMSDRISQRAFALFVILIPILTTVLNILSKKYIFNDTGLNNHVIYLCFFCLFPASILLILILVIIYPRLMHQLGREPHIIVQPQFYENEDFLKEKSYFLNIQNEIEDYQKRINFMETQNYKRLKKLKACYVTIIMSYLLIIAMFFI